MSEILEKLKEVEGYLAKADELLDQIYKMPEKHEQVIAFHEDMAIARIMISDGRSAVEFQIEQLEEEEGEEDGTQS